MLIVVQMKRDASLDRRSGVRDGVGAGSGGFGESLHPLNGHPT